jgi:hypothetical protein
VHVEHERDVEPALPGRAAGDVGHPQLVRVLRDEAPFNEVRRPRCGVVDDGGEALSSLHAPDPDLGHQPFDGAAGDGMAFTMELLEDPP